MGVELMQTLPSISPAHFKLKGQCYGGPVFITALLITQTSSQSNYSFSVLRLTNIPLERTSSNLCYCQNIAALPSLTHFLCTYEP